MKCSYCKENENFLVDSIEFRTPIGVKFMLLLFSPIVAPLWLLRKFLHKSISLKLEVKYKQK